MNTFISISFRSVCLKRRQKGRPLHKILCRRMHVNIVRTVITEISPRLSNPRMTEPNGKIFNNETFYRLESREFNETEPVVICVHGIGSYHVHFESLETALVNENFTVLSFDLKGRGYSPFPDSLTDENGDSVFNGDGHVKQMRDLIVGLNFHQRKYHLVGHSMGGAIVALYGNKYGAEKEILSLTMLTQAGLMDLGIIKIIRSWPCIHNLIKYMLRGNTSVFWNDFHLKGEDALPQATNAVEKLIEINKKHPHIFDAFWESAVHFPLSDNEAAIHQLASHHHINTLIMWADKDVGVPLEPNFKRWTDIYEAAQHPKLQTKVFKNAAHGFFIEQDTEFNQDMIRFLKGGKVMDT